MTADADDAVPDGDDETPDEGENGEDEGEIKKKLSKGTVIKIAAGAVAVLLIGGGTTAYFMGWIHDLFGIEHERNTATIDLGKPVSYELPQIVADLKTGKCRAPFLRATIKVQLSKPDLDKLQDHQDLVMERILMHLRDQERQDLSGKAGSDQLRFDLVKIINTAIAPVRVHGILFKEFMLQ